MASSWAPHMLPSDKMEIWVKSASKFLGLIAENLTFVNWLLTYNETLVVHFNPLTKQLSEY